MSGKLQRMGKDLSHLGTRPARASWRARTLVALAAALTAAVGHAQPLPSSSAVIVHDPAKTAWCRDLLSKEAAPKWASTVIVGKIKTQDPSALPTARVLLLAADDVAGQLILPDTPSASAQPGKDGTFRLFALEFPYQSFEVFARGHDMAGVLLTPGTYCVSVMLVRYVPDADKKP